MENSTVMTQQSYYIMNNDMCYGKKINNCFMAVNCAGACVINSSFNTDNRRGRNDFYLQYVAEGQMNVLINDQVKRMYAGDVIFYYPYTHYNYWNVDGNVNYYWAHFSGSETESLLLKCGFENAKIYSVGMHNRLISGFERLFQDFIARDRFFELSLGQTMTKMCIDIARLNTESANANDYDNRIDKVIERIHQNYDRPLSIAELASSVFLSEGRLRVLFRKKCGMSPQNYLTILRINTAKQLLEQSDITVAEVARSVGIADPLYFSRIFREKTGMSPSQYRKNML